MSAFLLGFASAWSTLLIWVPIILVKRAFTAGVDFGVDS